MQISRKADYAIRAMTILAKLGPDGSLQAQELADAGKVPIKFLEQILLALKKAGLLRSKRGVGGGYRLNRESRHISMAEIIESVDGELFHFCDREALPKFDGSAGVQHFLTSAEEKVNQLFADISLEEVIEFDAGEAMVGYGI